MGKEFAKLFFIFFLFLAQHTVLSQQEDFINGQIIDAKTGEPVVFASIYLKNRAVGVISNLDGGFRIPIVYQKMGDILVISSMGYQKQELSIYDLPTDKINMIRLNPAVFELSGATVLAKSKARNLRPKEIVQKAIDAILQNYPTRPYSMVGYYRDYQLDKKEYVNLNEAVLEVFDQGFNAIDSSTTRVLIYDQIENLDFRRDSLASRPYDYSYQRETKIIDKGYLRSYGGNEFTILSVHNAIRNYRQNSYSFVYQLQNDFLAGHQFFREDDAYMNDETLYSIKVYKKIRMHRAYGRLLISKSDFSIYGMEYTVYDDTKKNDTGIKDKNGSKNKVIFEVNTSYREKDGKMFLNYISFHNNFSVKIPPVFKLDHVAFKMHYDRMDDRKADINVNEEVRSSHFELTFTNGLDERYANKLRNYRAKFQGENVHFDSIQVVGKRVWLYPKIKSPIQRQILRDIEIFAVEEKLNEEVLEFDLKNLRDIEGNVFNEWKTKDYHQFREFFVQEVKPNMPMPSDVFFMDKNKPIFEDQPVTRPINFKDYWMNTPLRESLNEN